MVTNISGRSTISPDGTTIIPNRSTLIAPNVDGILTFFDNSLAAKTLVGDGPGNSAKGRLKALRSMIEVAGELVDQWRIAEARLQLQDACLRVDGYSQPPDFASGSAVTELAKMIQQLIDSLENWKI